MLLLQSPPISLLKPTLWACPVGLSWVPPMQKQSIRGPTLKALLYLYSEHIIRLLLSWGGQYPRLQVLMQYWGP